MPSKSGRQDPFKDSLKDPFLHLSSQVKCLLQLQVAIGRFLTRDLSDVASRESLLERKGCCFYSRKGKRVLNVRNYIKELVKVIQRRWFMKA
jgi:hypothetical protein